ncbi:MAG: hypothetical protein U0Y68_18335 [Blastocatellia bacterium]
MNESQKATLRVSLMDHLQDWLEDTDTPDLGGYEGNELARTMADACVTVLEASSNVQDYLRENGMLKD